MRDGIYCCSNQTLLICMATKPILIELDQIVAFNKLLCEINYFLIVLSRGVKLFLI